MPLPKMPEEVPLSWRDRLATVLCDWILQHVATDWYARRIDHYIRIGMLTVLKEMVESDEPFK